MLIPLTQGQFAIIDDEDLPKLGNGRWHTAKGKCGTLYASSGYRPHVRMHRLIMGLEKNDKRQVDHINHNGLDNRKSNLRIVTNQQNEQNKRNVKGYTWDKSKNKWAACIWINYKRIHLGRFDNEEDARNAYLEARKKYGFLSKSSYKL